MRWTSAGSLLPLLGLGGLMLAAVGMTMLPPPATMAAVDGAAKKMIYPEQSAPVYDGPQGKVIGTIPPGTPLVELGRKGRRVKVRIDAWSRGYAPLKLVADPGTMTPRGELLRFPEGSRTVSKAYEDEYHARWEQVAVTAWVNAKGMVKDPKVIWEAARSLQQERCTVCHEFKYPEFHTASAWRGILVIMSHRASLVPEERELLSQYLQAHAKQQE